MQYSLKKGVGKAALQLLTVAGSLIAFMGFSDLSIWSLIEQYLKPVVGSLTIGGLIALGINYVKFKLTA